MNNLLQYIPYKKVILITMGDPAGCGPELIAKSIIDSKLKNNTIIFGDFNTLKEAFKLYKSNIANFVSYNKFEKGKICITGTPLNKKFNRKLAGKLNKDFGLHSVLWIKEAVNFSKNLLKLDIPHSLTTAPINKKSASLSGFKFSGHTDYLAYLYQKNSYSMMFIGNKLKTILVTIHCSLISAIKKLNQHLIIEKIKHANYTMKLLGYENPEILVSGLNPHASENGLFGKEEENIIIPSVNYAKNIGINAKGPFSPDIIFLKSLKNKNSCVVSMYHDQALIAFKLLSFDEGVNLTIGLPIFRTSPDHGTAYDISWKGIASNKSFLKAYNIAVKLTGKKNK